MDPTEVCLKVWRDKILNSKRKELSPGELSSMFQQPELQKAFFNLIDRDYNGAISIEEWTGCFSKLLGDSDPQVLNWFVDKFNNFSLENEQEYLNEENFSLIVIDVEFGYRFASIISPKSRRVNVVHLISSLEIIASMSTDSKWLSWLKYQFTEAMIKSNRFNNNELHVTLNDFVENFNFKEPFLAQRLFSYLDKDSSGTLSLREFIDGLEVVVNGTQEEKMEFLFKVFDVDNDGYLSYEEMRMMLKCCLENSPSLDMEETVDDLAAALFKDTDKDESGDISIEELKGAFKRHESLFKTLSMSTSIWIKPKFINKKPKQKWHGKLKEHIINNRAYFIFWTSYAIVHLLCALTALISYRNENIFVIMARMCGNSLNFNCSFILVLVLRKHFTWLRSKGASNFIPIDDFIEIHKIIGVIILIETLIHTLAHFINLYIVCKALKFNYWTGLFTWELNLGFPTGVIEILLLFIILLFAMSFVRNHGFFQLFYWFHSLTIPWLLIMLTHGKVFWRWLLLPGFCYAIEKILRYRKVNSNKYGDSFITEAFVLPSKVTHLVIRRPPKFHYKPGDYIFINIPSIAKYEWHPFSISSAPENSEYIWLHIKACGNWTKRLYSFSSSANFDIENSTFNSQRSNLRTTMRTRMSRVYTDDSQMIDKSILKKSILDNNNHYKLETENNHLALPNSYYKKTVSFEKNMNLQSSPKKVQINESQVPTIHNTNERENIPPIQPPIRHKGILKMMSLNNQASFNGNETISSANIQGNDIVESTPKLGENKRAEEQQIQTNEINIALLPSEEVNNKDKVTDEDNKDYKTESSDTSNPKLALIKNSSQFKSIDLNDQNNKINDEYFTDAEKKDASVVINLNESTNKQNNYVIRFKQTDNNSKNNANENSYDSNGNYQFCGNYKKPGDFNKADKTDDVLGYLKMYKKANRINIQTIDTDNIWRLKVLIDGPYGTPSQDIFDSEHAVLIAAGIGITPFASILQSLMHKYRRAKASCPSCNYKLGDDILYSDEKLSVKKVDFIWVTREQRSLEWFISMLSQMEIEQRKNDDMFLETHLYVTSARRRSDLSSIGLHLTLDALFSHEESSLIDGLKQRTHYGRPNWDIVMQGLMRKHKGKINVFYCGLPSLAGLLQKKCYEYGLNFKKEVF